MGVCNGYHYHDLRPHEKCLVAIELCRQSVRGEGAARRAWVADDVMLAEIAAAPEDEEAREMY